MHLRSVLLASSFLLASPIDASASGASEAPATSPTTAEATAQAAFLAAAQACQADGGRLWGRPVCGPILLVDRRSRAVWANQADAEGKLRAAGGVFVGTLAADLPIANTAVDWAGKRWAMVPLPLPDEVAEQRRLLLHESFHRIQGDLGLPMASPANAHLDSVEGRLFLQLEWRALAAALRAAEPERRAAVRDALLFRWRRQALAPNAREEERQLELNEGLAQYTGARLAADDEAAARTEALAGLERGPRTPTFVRSFAYASGPAYGLLLDAALPVWRRQLDARSDLGTLLAQAYGIERPADLADAAAVRLAVYDGAALRNAEQLRHDQRVARVMAYRHHLIEGPVLFLPFREMNISFDPNELETLEGVGTVYPRAEIHDVWGRLQVTSGGVLLDPEWSSARVVAFKEPPAAGAAHGDGWTLELAPGWRLVPGQRAGDWTVKPAPESKP